MFKYDTWESTEAALRAVHALAVLLHEEKPPKGSPKEADWEAMMSEVRKWAVSIHNRRININIRNLNASRPKAS